jgi:lysophospholipase L1-like esterase
MKTHVAAALVVAVLAGAAQAQQPDACQVPDSFTSGDARLARVAMAAKQRSLRIVVLGTGSSSLAGPEGLKSAYPSRLEAFLKERLPKVEIGVSADVKARRTAAEMVVAIKQATLDAKANLVIWQTGTVDAMRGVDPDAFRATLEAGIAAAREARADVILVNMQYSPRTETMIAVQAYADAMHSVAQQQDVPLFDRLSVMKHWSETGSFDLSGRERSRVAEGVHDCLGRLLAQMVVDAAGLKQNDSKESR